MSSWILFDSRKLLKKRRKLKMFHARHEEYNMTGERLGRDTPLSPFFYQFSPLSIFFVPVPLSEGLEQASD